MSLKPLAVILTSLLLLSSALPVLWLFSLSIKSRKDILSSRPDALFPEPTLDNYREVLTTDSGLQYLGNSLFIASLSTMLALALGVPAAYAIGRLRGKARPNLLLALLGTRMLPSVTVAIPLFLLFRSIGLLDSRISVIVMHSAINVSLVVWLVTGFVHEIPTSLEDSAKLDGETSLGVLINILLPLIAPGIAVAALFSFIFSWNEFFFTMLLSSTEQQTITARIPSLITQQGTKWGQVAAFGVLSILPVLFLAGFVKKYAALFINSRGSTQHDR